MQASIDSIETFGLVDGPGIRCVVFFNGCKLRCKYCHNPEMWLKKENNYTPQDVFNKVMRCKPYLKKNGGVTFSGGEPLLHSDFIIETAKLLRKENIHIALDTAGVGLGNYEEILKYVDLVILDIKHTTNEGYKEITGMNINEVEKFIEALNKSNKKVWIRQVIIPDITDNEEYTTSLLEYIKKIKNIERIDFLPFHRLGEEKYKVLNIDYPYNDKNDMDKIKCQELYNNFIKKYEENK
ncbi:MAG: pyruvate formate-lyase-activating protein [bacterium]|nr:pyruvate formate-lyase-activating protein [bacterium]